MLLSVSNSWTSNVLTVGCFSSALTVSHNVGAPARRSLLANVNATDKLASIYKADSGGEIPAEKARRKAKGMLTEELKCRSMK